MRRALAATAVRCGGYDPTGGATLPSFPGGCGRLWLWRWCCGLPLGVASSRCCSPACSLTLWLLASDPHKRDRAVEGSFRMQCAHEVPGRDVATGTAYARPGQGRPWGGGEEKQTNPSVALTEWNACVPPPTAIGYPPTVVGYPLTAVGHPPTGRRPESLSQNKKEIAAPSRQPGPGGRPHGTSISPSIPHTCHREGPRRRARGQRA